MKRNTTVFGILVFVATVWPASAASPEVEADADGFAHGTDIGDAFAGVTLSSIGTGANGRVHAYTDAARASTGTNVFAGGYSGSSSFSPYWYSSRRLRADFDHPMYRVTIDIIGNDSSDYGILEAYNSSGILLASASSPRLTNSESWRAVIDLPSSSIAYAIASGVSGHDVHLDYLTAVPEPAAISLMALGSLALIKRRRR